MLTSSFCRFWRFENQAPWSVPRAKGSLKAGKEQTKKFEGKAKEDGEKLGAVSASTADQYSFQ